MMRPKFAYSAPLSERDLASPRYIVKDPINLVVLFLYYVGVSFHKSRIDEARVVINKDDEVVTAIGFVTPGRAVEPETAHT
jgi:hypothetical protein